MAQDELLGGLHQPDIMVAVRDCFGIDSGLQVPAFSEPGPHVPKADEAYRFNADVTLALLAGPAHNRRVLVQRLHGTGKSTHIEQVAARLNWPCLRVNLDGHLTRLDLVGRDAVVLETMEGLLLYTVAQLGRSKATNEPVVAATEDQLEATRFGLAPHIGSDLAQLRRLRERLDVLVEDNSVNVRGLARQLHRLFASQEPRNWDAAQEEGLVDSGRLSRLVTSTPDARVFRTPSDEPTVDAQVTLLLDCPGSMRRHQEQVAVLVDVLVRALELAGVRTEILGYTTAAWNGGRPLRDWRRAGRPAQPGRLNERLHIVVKDADQQWSGARRQVAGLLRGDYFREALDGEAVEWAYARLRDRPDLRHRILLVLSDGSPMDSATALVHGSEYLDRHLSDVLDRVDAEGSVRVIGLGVGLDLSGFYRRGHVLDLDRPVDRGTLREVAGMLARAVRPS